MGGKGSHRTCVICGVKERRNSNCPLLFTQFPLNEIRCKEWLRAVGNEELVHLPIEKLNQLRHICINHFRPKHINRKGNRLKKSAVPMLNLTAPPLTDAQLIGFPQHMFKNKHGKSLHSSDKSGQQKDDCRKNDDDSLDKACDQNPIPDDTHEQKKEGVEKIFTDEKKGKNQGQNKNDDDSLDKANDQYMISDDIHGTDNPVEDFEEIVVEKKVCRICLESDRKFHEELDEALVEFYDELVYYDTYEHGALRVCLFCEHQLRRSYNFRQECRRAHILLKTWSTDEDKKPMNELYKMLPRLTIGASNTKSNQKVFSYKYTFPNDAANLLVPEQLTSSIKVETKNFKNTDNGTLDLKSYVQHFLKDSEPENVQFEPGNVHVESGNVQFESGKVQFEPGTVQFEPDIGFDTQDMDGNTGNGDSLDTNRSVEAKITFEHSAKNKKSLKVKLSELNPEERTKLMKQKKITSRSKRYAKNANLLKSAVVRLMDNGELQGVEDLGVTLDKELFLKIYDNCPHNSLLHWGVLTRGMASIPRLRRFLLFLLKRYNPKYETMFNVEWLNTDEKKIAEFKSRQHSKEYLEAHYKCDICYKVFEVQGLLDFHKNWHDPKSTNVCSICSMSHKTMASLKRHKVSNHQYVFRCKLCPLFTNSPDRMKTHYHEHLGAEYECHICKKKFKFRSTMENHKRVHLTTHLCPFCAKNLQSPMGLRMHLNLKHSNESPEMLACSPSVECDQCSAAFHAEDTLKRHVAMVHKRNPMIKHCCFYCKEEFDSVSALHKHKVQSEHRGRRRVFSPPAGGTRTCPLCHEKVACVNSIALYTHYKKAHPGAPYEVRPAARNYLCEHCGKGFRARPVYEDHLNTHTGNKPYECSECGARFASRINAKSHVDGHGPPNYRCDKCPKAYKTASALCRHTRSHQGTGKYVCRICSKAFTHSDSLKLHVDGVHCNKRKIRNKRKLTKTQDLMKNEAVVTDQMKDEAVVSVQMKNEAMIKDETKVTYVIHKAMFRKHMKNSTQNQIKDENQKTDEIQNQMTDEEISQDQMTDEDISQDQMTDEIQNQMADEDISQNQMTDEIQNQMADEDISQDQMTDETACLDQFSIEYVMNGDELIYSQEVANEEIVSAGDYYSDEYDEF